MFISKECDYAVRIVRALADGEKKTAEDIGRREAISQQFAYKILKKLEKSGLVRALRGKAGGYALTRGLDEFSLYDVFSALEGRILLTACLRDGFACPMNRGASPCGVHREFVRLQEMLAAGLKEKTISEVLGLTRDPDVRVSGFGTAKR
ncbi:MAG: Rrf2 family transcriptional regulator [Clostridiales Family XIII bacterium]|jgi:Rrf2 family protein|nr:Rrf2 family transcriptional regulator [Clostridiales Family XIII bacterium]